MEPSYWRSCLQIPKVRYPYEKDHPLKVLSHAFTDVGVEMRLDWRLGLEHAVGLGKGLKPRKTRSCCLSDFNVYGGRDEMRVWAFHFLGLPEFQSSPTQLRRH